MKVSQLTFEYQGTISTTPIYTLQWSHPGKHIVISGGMHGNEINGIMMCEYVRQYFSDPLIKEQLRGTITFVPVLNPLWFDKMERYIPIDGVDLNRSFGYQESTTFSQAYAQFLIQEIFQHVDHAIDIHDAGGRLSLLPHARIHQCTANQCNLIIHQMATWFDNKIILEREWDPHMLAVYANDQLNLPIMTIELWWNQMIHKNFYADTLYGINNILKWFAYLPGEVEIFHKNKQYLSTRIRYTAKAGGVVNILVCLGQEVKKDQKVAEIYYPQTDHHEDIMIEESWFVFAVWSWDQISKWKQIISILKSSS